ncbi:MAG: hypothetical protein ABR878_18660 [Roseiarcus sp.]|jgi:hypothetical protein
MVELVRHRQTKGAATDTFDLQPPRHTPTLPRLSENSGDWSIVPIFIAFSSILSDQKRAN